MNEKIRNIAIIAHVDHGKTTLVDSMIKQSSKSTNLEERAMDSNDIEKERGITILSKCTSIMWKDYKINILDTPGHSDFSAEVERILSMVDGFVLIVDAVEAVMPQTKFVLSKAVQNKLHAITVINKIDRDASDPDNALKDVMNLIFDMDNDMLESPYLFGSGREGYLFKDLNKAKKVCENIKIAKESGTQIDKVKEECNIFELFDTIIEKIPAPKVNDNKTQVSISMVDYDEYFGQLLVGKIYGGSISTNDTVIALNQNGEEVESFRVNKLFTFINSKREIIDTASAGDIIAIAGASISTVSDTIVSDMNTAVIPSAKIDPPIFSVVMSVNTSPLVGKDGGKKLTLKQISDRLMKEQKVNVGVKIKEIGESFEIAGRGELQLSIIMETMRREGFEFTIKSPKIVFKEVNGKIMEPYENIMIDVNTEYAGSVMENMSSRGATLLETSELEDGKRMRLQFYAATRLMLGYHSKLLSDTRGTGVMNKQFDKYDSKSDISRLRQNGLLVSMENGTSTAYALDKLSDRGVFFIEPGTTVYKGMVIGEHNRDNSLEVNVIKTKQLTNVRASGKDDAIHLAPPQKITLEKAITYIGDGEQIEVTPKNIRLRVL